MMAFLPVLNFILFYFYGKSLTRIGPKRTAFWTAILSALGIFATLGLIHIGFNLARGFLFLFREVYIVLLVEAYWSLMDSLVDGKESKHINYFFTAFTSVGAVLAGLTVGRYATSIGTFSLPLITAAFLIPSAILTNLSYRDNEKLLAARDAGTEKTHSTEIGKTLGTGFFKKYPVLGYLMSMVLVSQLLSTVLGLMFQEKLHVNFPNQSDLQTAYAGNFYAILNGASIIFQLVIGPFILSRFSPAATFIVVPLINLFASSFALWNGSMVAISFAFLIFKAMDYSIFRATKETIFTAYPFDVRYRTKGMIDVVGYRLSKGLGSAGFAFIGIANQLSLTLYGSTAVGCAVLWAAMLPGFKRSYDSEGRAGVRT
jgi:ATP/ADP translocase